MSYMVTRPELLASAAAHAEQIGSTIAAAGTNAAQPTTGLLAAAQDEVSAAIAKLRRPDSTCVALRFLSENR